MNVLILGDVHLGKSQSIGRVGIGSALNSRISDQMALLDWTLEQATENVVEHIIITGDVFEEPKPHPSLIALFISWLKRCQLHNISVHIIVGNHDLLRSGSVYSSPLDIISEAELEKIYVYKDVDTIIIGTSAFTLIPYRDRKSFSSATNKEALEILNNLLVYELAGIPLTYTKVLIGHLAIEGSIPVGDEIDDLTNELFCPLKMFNGYDYVWMGHVHKPQVLQKENPYIAHIGSMDISNFGETDHKKHIIILNAIVKDTFTTKYLPTRPLQKINISIPKDVQDTTSYVLEEIKKAGVQDKGIIRVEVALTAPELQSINKATIEKFLLEQGASSINTISESKKVSLIKKDINNNIDTKMDISSAIKAYAQSYIEEANRSSFIELSMDIVNVFKNESKE